MPRNGSGTYSRAVTPPINGDVATATDFNTEMDDISSALTTSINTAGTKAFAANQPMGGYILTGLGEGSASGHSVRYEQMNAAIAAAAAAAQPLDADLTAIAALGYTSGDYIIKKTAADTWALIAITAAGANLIDDASIEDQRITLGGSGTGIAVFVSANQAAALTALGVSAAAQTILDDASTAAIATTLGLGTSDVPQFSGVNVGSSDTTISRSAAGAIAVEGVPVAMPGKQAIPIPAGAMLPSTTSGAASANIETTTNKVNLTVLDFDPNTQEFGHFNIAMPKSWDESTVTMQFCYTATNTGDVMWGFQARAMSDDDPLDGAWGTQQDILDSVTAANDVMWTAETPALTIGGTPAEGDIVFFRVYRNGGNGSDTCAVDARLIAVRLLLTTNAANDA